ncbi:hypothetical protein BDZ45DRAFT_677550 [Acephala macrosclerotiorum]|nr:hypothetical protein BDZ45DRAFT_677550 [Acephala macrosclerotiorum]
MLGPSDVSPYYCYAKRIDSKVHQLQVPSISCNLHHFARLLNRHIHRPTTNNLTNRRPQLRLNPQSKNQAELIHVFTSSRDHRCAPAISAPNQAKDPDFTFSSRPKSRRLNILLVVEIRKQPRQQGYSLEASCIPCAMPREEGARIPSTVSVSQGGSYLCGALGVEAAGRYSTVDVTSKGFAVEQGRRSTTVFLGKSEDSGEMVDIVRNIVVG